MTDPEQHQSTKVKWPKESSNATTWPETAVREQKISPLLEKTKKKSRKKRNQWKFYDQLNRAEFTDGKCWIKIFPRSLFFHFRFYALFLAQQQARSLSAMLMAKYCKNKNLFTFSPQGQCCPKTFSCITAFRRHGTHDCSAVGFSAAFLL